MADATPALSDFKVLCFDVYGTLIDWESGIVNALQPLLGTARYSKEHLLDIVHELESKEQAATPDLPYAKLLATIYPQIAVKLGRPEPTPEESKAFGSSVGKWPAFPDTVDALRRLAKHYKLVVLSNVDRDSFRGTNSGPLGGIPFDLVLTAQDIGSYKPDLKNFSYMLIKVQDEFGVGRDLVLQTAQSQFHDHHPARASGIHSSWIARAGAVMGNRTPEIYDWKFNTLGEMADAVEAELASKQEVLPH